MMGIPGRHSLKGTYEPSGGLMGIVVMCDVRVILNPGIQKQQLTRLKLSGK